MYRADSVAPLTLDPCSAQPLGIAEIFMIGLSD